jgi:hypothetical protein
MNDARSVRISLLGGDEMNTAITAMANLLAQKVDVDKRKKELFVS